MYRDINDFLEVNGLQSVTILFSILSKFEQGHWKMLEAGDGFALYQQLKSIPHFTVSEANTTQFPHFNEELKDTYYAARFDALHITDPKQLKKALSQTKQIRTHFVSPQIFINDYYELNENDKGLEKFANPSLTKILKKH